MDVLLTFKYIINGLFPFSRNYPKEMFKLYLLRPNSICHFEKMMFLAFSDLPLSSLILAPSNNITIALP